MNLGYILDSTVAADYSKIQNKNTLIAPLTLLIDGEIKTGAVNDDVVSAILDNKEVKTSQPAPGVYLENYKKLFDKKVDYILVFTVSSVLSGSYNSAKIARDMLDEKLKDKVFLIDTMTGGYGSFLLYDKAQEYSKQYNDIDKVVSMVNRLAENAITYFMVDNLKTIRNTGRLGGITYFVATILKMKPILQFYENKLVLAKKSVFGELRAKRALHDKIDSFINEHKDKKITIYTMTVNDENNAVELADKIKEKFPEILVVNMGNVSPIIASHIGPGGLGFYVVYE